MKIIYLFFVVSLIAVALAGYEQEDYQDDGSETDGWMNDNYDYEEEDGEDSYGYQKNYEDDGEEFKYKKNKKMDKKMEKKIVPEGEKCCKCIKKCGQKCIKMQCCQKFKIIYKKYPKKPIPTLPFGGK